MSESNAEGDGDGDALAQASQAARRSGDLPRARVLAEQCLAHRRAEFGDDHRKTAEALGLVAAAHRRGGDLELALTADRQALAVYETQCGPDHPETAVARGNLSATHRLRGEHDLAQTLAERALANLQASLGEDDPQTATAWGNLAAVHGARGAHDEAVACARKLVELRQKSAATDPLALALAQSTLGALLAAAGDLAGALDAETCALAGREASGDGRAVLESLVNLAAIHRSRNDAGQALQFQQRALAAQRQLLGDTDPATTRSRVIVAYTLLRLGRQPEAIRLVDEGRRHAPGDPDLKNMQQQLKQQPRPGFRAPSGKKPRRR